MGECLGSRKACGTGNNTVLFLENKVCLISSPQRGLSNGGAGEVLQSHPFIVSSMFQSCTAFELHLCPGSSLEALRDLVKRKEL
jgi:hypothetical protein